MHFIQKYGFTLIEDDQMKNNVVQGSYSFGDYQQIVYEEARLKAELSKEKGIAFDTERFQGVNLFANKREQPLLARLRLSFLTSQTIREVGGTSKVKALDFGFDFNEFNEECSV